jgi:hypothetical protein
MSVPGYVPGDHWRICDVCGFQYRASQTFKRWDGLITCSEDWEPRHPQDFVRGRKDRQNAPDPRSEQVDTFLGPLMTNVSAVASAGATTFSVDSSTRFLAADHIGVTLDTGNVERHVIQSIPSATSIEITAPLGGALSVGAVVINYSAVTAPSL